MAIVGLSLAVSLGLGGCASGGMLDQLPPALGGEPDSLPPRPKTGYQFPAVHDMPPARATAPMNDTDQVRLEKELGAARDRQEALYGSAPKATAPAAKKKPAAAKSGGASGAKTNP
ncbi:MAG: hypothetical protein Q8M24_01340 [Pseudolabrys sp.]|nr:hypothetical protein [Pseudolabrys sp.]MDP2294089.1 hypothetical protein [Pseudolabrys sp.]